ncbi:MAG: SCP2 sterol-binding domain-containing protein [Eubacteriales bacterium]|nr:SCP2 sterol-binding domain-containing protein [Eubacteriales bacterium]
MTFEQAFLKIKAKFDNADTSKLTNEFAIQVNMTDEDCGGAFYIQYTDGKLFVEPYDYRDNTADVTLNRADLNKILDKKLSVATALESNRLYINGNAEDFIAAAGVIKAPEKKAAAPKKATARKATAKPAAAKKATAKTVSEKKAEEKPIVEKKAPAKKTVKKTTK